MQSSIQTSGVPLVLELFALDTTTCGPCESAMASLHAAAATLDHELTGLGYVVATRVVLLEDGAHARALGIVGSPTVRINGHDVALDLEEGECASCSTLAGVEVSCRTYEWGGTRFDHPPVPLILGAVHRHLESGARRPGPGPALPAGSTSVDRFFTAREGKHV